MLNEYMNVIDVRWNLIQNINSRVIWLHTLALKVCRTFYSNSLHVYIISIEKILFLDYHCDYCEKSYRYIGDRNKHLRIHLGEKIYKCPDCPKKFKYHTELQKHSFKHYKEQNKTNKWPDVQSELEGYICNTIFFIQIYNTCWNQK